MSAQPANDESDWEELGAEIVGYIKPALQRIALLEMKIARLEAMIEHRNFAYLGVWKEGRSYGVGHFVTYSGAIWHCNQFNTTTRPGDGAAAWTLACKAGRDGRDATK